MNLSFSGLRHARAKQENVLVNKDSKMFVSFSAFNKFVSLSIKFYQENIVTRMQTG